MQIKFDHVYYTYSPKSPYEHAALKDVNLEIKEGSFTAIVGRTGSGKSTLIQHLNALLLPTSGEVLVDEYILSSDKKRRTKKLKNLRQKVGVVFQFSENQLFEDTVIKDVMFGPMNFGVKIEEAKEIAKKCLKQVGLDESYYERSPFDLSGGEKRRVAIAGVLALSPSLLVLDEPTAGLDPIGTKEMMELFKKMNNEGTTIVFVTHDMSLIINYASDVVIIHDKKVAKEVTSTEVFLEDEEQYALETPIISKVAKELIAKGMKLDLNNVKDASSLAKEIMRVKKNG